MKFGGTSVGDGESIRRTAAIIASFDDPCVVVVSAMAGVTDTLIEATRLAEKQNHVELTKLLETLRTKHVDAVNSLELEPEKKHPVVEAIDALLASLKIQIQAIAEAKKCTPEHYDAVLSFGERLSIHQVAAAVEKAGRPTRPVEATSCIVTTAEFGDAEPLLDSSASKTASVLVPLLEDGVTPVVTGFIGATTTGKTTTLGRGASDYTATILGYCINSRQVWIWTDVTGVMTADPKLIPEATTIANLSYEEASELSYFGAKVLHPLTMVPASLKRIPIYIKNTFEPEAAGTRIASESEAGKDGVKAITVKSEMSLVTVQGKGVMGVPSVAAKVFGALASEKIDVFLISQASSEHNISFVIKGSSGAVAVERVHGELTDEMTAKSVDIVQLRNGLSIVAVVGNGVYSLPEVTTKTFASLGAASVDVIAIAYGSSERSLSFVVESSEAVTALRSLHQTFRLVEQEGV